MLLALGADDEDEAGALTPEIIASAHRWARAYGLPARWVLATILAESRGNPRAVGDYHIDPRGASIGLMQVNTVASAAALKRAGVTRADLFNPDINIQWGAAILRRKYDQVRDALSKTRRPSPVPVDVLTRLLYTGVDTIRHIYRGTDPRPNARPTVVAWNRYIAAVEPLAPAPGPVSGFGRPPHPRPHPPRPARPRFVHQRVYAPAVTYVEPLYLEPAAACTRRPYPIPPCPGVLYWVDADTVCCR